MPEKLSHYPISVFLHSLIDRYAPSRSEFVRTLGYRESVESGLGRLMRWLERGEGFRRIIKSIAAVYPDHAEAMEAAIRETKAMQTAEREAAFLERCKAEAASFIPFLHAEGERTVPQPVTFFALAGGYRWTTIQIPPGILGLPLEQQLEMLPKLMAAYTLQYEGQVPFFGRLTGFKFVRALDYVQFSADGRLLKHVQKPFRHGECWVELR